MATVCPSLFPPLSSPKLQSKSCSSITVPPPPHPKNPRSDPDPSSTTVQSSHLTPPPPSQPGNAPVPSSGAPPASSALSPPPCPTSVLPSLSCPNLVPVAGVPPVISQAPPPSNRAPPLSSSPDPVSIPRASAATPSQKSYAQATRTGRGHGFVRAHALAVEPFARIPRTGINVICGARDGLPSLSFASSDLPKVEEIFANALVMKFSGGRPSLEASHKEISSWGMENQFSIGPLSSRAFLLRFVDNRDLLKVLTRPSTILISFPYKICRWHSLSHLSEDSGLAPVWVSLPRLPLQCFVPEFLESLGNTIGKFLCFDRATATLARPSTARICVELDLRNPPPQFIWVGLFDGFKQQIIYERMPKFCVGCNRLGHATLECSKSCIGNPPSSAEAQDPIVQSCTPAVRQNAHSSSSAVSLPTSCPAPPIHAGKPITPAMSPHPADSALAQPTIPVEPQPKAPNSSSQHLPPYQEANASIQPASFDRSTSDRIGDNLRQLHSIPTQAEDSLDRTMVLPDHQLQYQLHPCIRKRLKNKNSVSFAGQAKHVQSNISANQDFWSAVNRQVAILDHARVSIPSPLPPSSIAANSQLEVGALTQAIIPVQPHPDHSGVDSSGSSIAADSLPPSPNSGSFSYASEGEDHFAVPPKLQGYNTDDMLDKLPSISRRNKRHPDQPLTVRLRGRKGPSSALA